MTASLLSLLVNSVAIEYRRAPLPVSRRMVEVTARSFRPGNLGVLKAILRRYLFTQDEWIAVEEIGREADASQIAQNRARSTAVDKSRKAISSDARDDKASNYREVSFIAPQ